jgi:hypothetical protein
VPLDDAALTRPLNDAERAVAEAALAPVLADLRATSASLTLEVHYESHAEPDSESVMVRLAGSEGKVHMGVWIPLEAPG